jgi:hypothetical protein
MTLNEPDSMHFPKRLPEERYPGEDFGIGGDMFPIPSKGLFSLFVNEFKFGPKAFPDLDAEDEISGISARNAQ